MQLPYLSVPLVDTFDAWLTGTLSRFVPPLTFTEVRKGVQALSSLYVERRREGRLATRAIEGTGKRAALATYYAALHFLTAHHALRMIERERLGPVRRVADLGCGTGAVGAAVGATLDGVREIVGFDRSGWALEEAERTWGAFGLKGRPVREDLPGAVPRGGPGTLLVFGWSASELGEEELAGLLRRIIGALRKGSTLFLLEPLSTRVTPWWETWKTALAPHRVQEELIRVAIDRPGFVRDMDKAARLDHQVIGARLLYGGARVGRAEGMEAGGGAARDAAEDGAED